MGEYVFEYQMQGWGRDLLIRIVDEEIDYEDSVVFVPTPTTLQTDAGRAKLHLVSRYEEFIHKEADNSDDEEGETNSTDT